MNKYNLIVFFMTLFIIVYIIACKPKIIEGHGGGHGRSGHGGHGYRGGGGYTHGGSFAFNPLIYSYDDLDDYYGYYYGYVPVYYYPDRPYWNLFPFW